MQVRVDRLTLIDIEPHIFLMQQALQGNCDINIPSGACVEFVLETGEKETRYMPTGDDEKNQD